MAAACRGSWKGNEGNLGACPVYSLTSQVTAAVLKRFTGRLSPQNRLCNLQLAFLLKAKGSYLSANSGWPHRADWGWGVGLGGRAERSRQSCNRRGDPGGGMGRGGREEDKGSRQSYPALSLLPPSL